MFVQFLINGLITGCIYAIASLGFALVYNTTRIFHIAYSSLYVFAAYMLYLFLNILHFQLWISIFLGICLTITLSSLMEYLVYLPLKEKRTSLNISMVSSIGVMIVLINSISLGFGNETKVFHEQTYSSYNMHGLVLTQIQIIQFVICISVIVCMWLFFTNSNIGLLTRALRDNPLLCEIYGHNIDRIRIKIFCISGFLVAIAGMLSAYDLGTDPYTGIPMFLNAIVALIIGGIGRFIAPIIGGIILGILQALTVWQFSANWQNAITFFVLILFLLLRPQGIVGEKQRII